MTLPERIWVCPNCRAQFVEAWRLKRHIMITHELSERSAWALTDRNEYWLRVRRAAYISETEPDVSDAPQPDRRRRLRNG